MIFSAASIAWAPTPKITLLATRFRVGTRRISASESPLDSARMASDPRYRDGLDRLLTKVKGSK